MAAAFRLWPSGLPVNTEVFGVQYPGRGSRIGEAPIDRIAVMAQFIMRALLARPPRPTVFFGHSMGSLVAFEVARLLGASGHPLPVHMLLSGHAPPHLPAGHPPLSHLPDLDFLEQLNQLYAAVPAELLQHPDVLALLLPALRADIAAVEHHLASPRAALACPVTAFGGADDVTATPAQLAAWRDATTASFRLRLFPGGHFYINTQREAVLAEISAILQQEAAAALALAPSEGATQ